MSVDGIHRAGADDVGSISLTLGEAFQDDPIFGWQFPDASSRSRILPALFALIARHIYVPAGASTACKNGAALWQPPEARIDDGFQAEHGNEFLEAVEGQVDRLLRLAGGLEAIHPTQRHWYLPLIGVRPVAHGRGIGSSLLTHTLRQVDEAEEGAYLEATTPRNCALYKRHGFEVVGEFSIDDSPVMWPMWRDPVA